MRAPELNFCVTLGKVINLSVLEFLDQEHEDG